MQNEIESHECIVIVATQRFQQLDLGTGDSRTAISEMLHVEAGMGFALGKPILVFARRDVNVGAFLPGVTQYVRIPETDEEASALAPLIHEYLVAAQRRILEQRQKQSSKELLDLGLKALAAIGAFGVVKSMFDSGGRDDDGDDDDDGGDYYEDDDEDDDY